jgi:putative ABC transport system ATP-binding protein
MRIAGRKPDEHWVASIVETVGLTGRLGHRPVQLSGGQQQRVAAARALASRPEIVFADEPTGALDSVAADEIMELLVATSRDTGAAVVVVTHEARVAAFADRGVSVRDGLVVTAPRSAGALR